MMTVGDTLPVWRIESVNPQNMRRLAETLRDPNPIHLDPSAVAKLGLGDRVINQGPANLAYIINMLHAAFPGAQLLQLDARFLANVFGGDSVEASGRITAIADGGKRITCDTWLNVDGRGPAVSAQAQLLMGARA
ncbi:MAG TPA: MaoC family dehydratase [Steroidobacter sp.]|uniref:MaoC family dehydratase n=1 Tax=Steroidobacter sp. TaxID=1978227 RepID=UPI002ED83733